MGGRIYTSGICRILVFIFIIILVVLRVFLAILLLIFFVFVFGAQLWLILVLLVAFSWPGLTILVRSMVLGLSGSQEVEAARALGASSRHILVKHIFPHTAPYVFTQLIFFVPAVILAEAGLSFLGLGIQPPTADWGSMVRDNATLISFGDMTPLIPAAAIALISASNTDPLSSTKKSVADAGRLNPRRRNAAI